MKDAEEVLGRPQKIAQWISTEPWKEEKLKRSKKHEQKERRTER